MKSITLVAFIAMLTIMQSCSEASGRRTTVHEATNKGTADILRDAGFTSATSIDIARNTEVSRVYMKKYGMEYMSDIQAVAFAKGNDLTLSGADKYIGDIPTDAMNTIAANLTKVKSLPVLNSYSGNKGDWFTVDNNPKGMIMPKIMVLAPADKLKTVDFDNVGNGFHARGKDPIALFRVHDGWLVLAKW